MPVADYAQYCQMLERVRKGRFAYPAVDVTSLTTANAVLNGLADSKSDGIIEVSTGGGAFASGAAVKDMAHGAISIAEHVHRAAARYPIYVALATDHCQADKVDTFLLRVDGEVGNKKVYDPRSYMALAEKAMAARVVRATTELRSAGTTMS
jgi:fructose-bisphosphate aldolase class II